MGLPDMSNKKPTHSEKVLSAYLAIRPNLAEIFFPGKVQQADKVITSLAQIMNMNLKSLDTEDYLSFLVIYTKIYVYKIYACMNDDEIIEKLQEKHGDFVKSPATARAVLTFAALSMLNCEFVFEEEADIDLLFGNIAADDQKNGAPKDGSTVELGFYFENIVELAIYGKLFGKGLAVRWLKGNLYISQYNKGYQLVEEGKYQEAIAALNASLKLNPIGITARFELCECYIRLSDLDKARKILIDMSAYLLEVKHIAKFYRRIGYIELESGSTLSAVACYVYSRNFENHFSVEQELQYIGAKIGVNVNTYMDTTPILKKSGIPVLVKRTLDDIHTPQ